MSKQGLRVIISGGGTGGHIFPAIAIANAIKELMPETVFLFVGAKGRMEMEKVPAAGYEIVGLNISGLQRQLKWSTLVFPFKVLSSLIKAKRIVKEFKPDVAIGVGGYASGPLLYAAASRHIPSLIQEQNSFPGITNRILAKKVQKICVAYKGMSKFFPGEKILLTGNPVRKNVIEIDGKRSEAMEYFGLIPGKPVVLIVGGSQGARSINNAIAANIRLLLDSDVNVVWQCGKFFKQQAEEIASRYHEKSLKVHVFINRMDLAYAVADVIVSRAGASTVSELCIVGKPAILVPLPTAAEDHQTKNCIELVNNDAAILVKDEEASKKLTNEIVDLLSDRDKRKRLSENILKLALHDSDRVIAETILSMTGRNE